MQTKFTRISKFRCSGEGRGKEDWSTEVIDPGVAVSESSSRFSVWEIDTVRWEVCFELAAREKVVVAHVDC